MKHLLVTLLTILLLSSPVFGQSDRPESIVVPVASVGDVTDTRRQILQNTLEEKLKNYFKLISQKRFEEAQEKAFEELDFEECTEDQCIMKIQELLQVENVFSLQIISEGQDTQLSLSRRTLDEKRKETAICRGCDTFALNERIENMVDKLMAGLPSQASLAQKTLDQSKLEKEEEAKRKEEEANKKSKALNLEKQIKKEKKLAKQKEEDKEWAKKQSLLWGKNDYTGYSFNLFSPIGYPDNQNVKGFRFNFIYGDHENVRGLDLGFVNKANTFQGVQMTLMGVNIVTEEMRGLQVAPVGFNYAKKGDYQLGISVNIVEEAKIQATLLVNWAKSVEAQLGILNVATDDVGLQFGLLMNYADRPNYQFSTVNFAKNPNVQIGILNIAETLEGRQYGFFNIAKYSNGCQIGIWNWTIEKESGFPLIPGVNCSN